MSGAALFRGLKREIALATAGRSLTQQEIAVALGRNAADIQKTLRQMVADDIVEPLGGEQTRGTRYRLHAGFEASLEQELEAEQAPGVVLAGQRVMLVKATSVLKLNAVVGDLASMAAVAWAAPGASSRELMLVLRSDATTGQVGDLEMALERIGAEYPVHHVTGAISGKAMRGLASRAEATVSEVDSLVEQVEE